MFSEYLTANKNCVRKGEVLLTDSSVLVTEPEIARAIHRVLSHGFVLVVPGGAEVLGVADELQRLVQRWLLRRLPG